MALRVFFGRSLVHGFSGFSFRGFCQLGTLQSHVLSLGNSGIGIIPRVGNLGVCGKSCLRQRVILLNVLFRSSRHATCDCFTGASGSHLIPRMRLRWDFATTLFFVTLGIFTSWMADGLSFCGWVLTRMVKNLLCCSHALQHQRLLLAILVLVLPSGVCATTMRSQFLENLDLATSRADA